MKMVNRQVVIIGGGPGGLAAAVKLHRNGVRDIVILEREHHPGGILRQCIHDGFGLIRFRQSLSGPEYAQRFVDELQDAGIECRTDTTVLDITPDRVVTAVSRDGLQQIQADAVVLTTGCRERTRGAISIPGTRPAGVFTAGVAQAYLNLKNTMPGKRVVVLGSGDIGMIMARRLTLEGADVLAVFEAMPYASGLPRNLEQCLNDFDIPLYLSHTVTDIHGASRLEAVTVSRVDDRRNPVPGTERRIACDTLILSVGLIPENELALAAGVVLDPLTGGALVDEHLQTGVAGIFAAGNALHVHDLVDNVSLEAEQLARSAAAYLERGLPDCAIRVCAGDGVRYTVPHRVSGTRDVRISLRTLQPMRPCVLQAVQNGTVIGSSACRRAIPAEMEHLDIPASEIRPGHEIRVVAVDEQQD